jgi:CubicO group peptidase (beta-lactamase class C family)
VKQASYGLASIEFSAPATSATLYQIASATKSFTATAVMMLVEEGKFRTTDSITKLLPGLPGEWNAVTVRQLLSHTSGLPDLLARPGYGPLRWVTRKEALDSLPLQPMAGTPGGQWIYNQTNYLLLQDLVEKYCGESLPKFIQRRIFDPLGMKLHGLRFADGRTALRDALRVQGRQAAPRSSTTRPSIPGSSAPRASGRPRGALIGSPRPSRTRKLPRRGRDRGDVDADGEERRQVDHRGPGRSSSEYGYGFRGGSHAGQAIHGTQWRWQAALPDLSR